MGDILKDVQVLTAHHAFQSPLRTKAQDLDEAQQALEQVSREKSSLPDAMFEQPNMTNVNYGRDQINNMVQGIQNNVKKTQFNAQGNQYFGIILYLRIVHMEAAMIVVGVWDVASHNSSLQIIPSWR